MSEYKQVLYDLRTSYNGPFIVEDFYAEVDNWIKEKGYEKEPKKKLEHVTKSGKKIEYVIEAHTHLDEFRHGSVILKVMMDNIKEVVVKRDNKKVRVNSGDVFVDINGFIEGHTQGSFYHTKPIYTLMRTLIDKYIYNFSTDKYDGRVNSDCRDLFKRIRSFFELQKYKYG